jgi:SAM-dependent methyltransferase
VIRAHQGEMDEQPEDSIRENYDRVSGEYARRLYDELEGKPFDRRMLDRFALEVAGKGDVCDLGCGPGQVARRLRDAGVSVFGLDLSPRMVDQARRLNPDISFREGNMLALDLESESLAGIAAFYAIVNLPVTDLPLAFLEMRRVLKPGGVLLLAFHVGNQTVKPDDLLGVPISMDFNFFLPSVVTQHLLAAGLLPCEILEREPYAPDIEHQSKRAYIFARRANR